VLKKYFVALLPHLLFFAIFALVS